MAKVKVKAKVKKVKRKFPVEIVAPEFLNSAVLGKSEVTDLSSMAGKTCKINLMYVTNNVRNQNVRLTFRVEEVNSGKATTVVSKYEQIPYYLGRYVKKDSNLIEDSSVYTTKDGVQLRIKPFVVTKSIASAMIQTALRLKVKELIAEEVAKVKADEFMNSVIFSKVQNLFKNEAKKIFPLKVFEFKKVEIVNE